MLVQVILGYARLFQVRSGKARLGQVRHSYKCRSGYDKI
jgi:hypothetical protein